MQVLGFWVVRAAAPPGDHQNSLLFVHPGGSMIGAGCAKEHDP